MATFAATNANKASERAETAVATASKAWAWIGVTSAILGVFVTWSVQFLVSEDALVAGGDTLFADITSGNNEVMYRVTSGLGFVLIAMLITYGVGLYRHLDAKAEGRSVIPAVMLGAFLVTAGSLAVAMSFRAQVFDGMGYYTDSPASHITLNRLQQDTVLTSWACLLGAVVCVAAGGLRGTLFPKPLAIFSALVALAMTVFCLGGVAFPAGAMVALPWFVVFSIWSVRQPAAR